MKNNIFLIFYICLTLGIFLVLVKINNKYGLVRVLSSSTTAGKDVKFLGTIREYNKDCSNKDICKIRVDDKWVELDRGDLTSLWPFQEAVGVSINTDINEASSILGKKVEVYAREIEGEEGIITIYGDTRYYVRLLE